MIEAVEQVDALNGAALSVVEMPGNQVVFGHMVFGLHGVVKDEHAVMGLNLANQGLNLAPEVAGSKLRPGEKASDGIMADAIV